MAMRVKSQFSQSQGELYHLKKDMCDPTPRLSVDSPSIDKYHKSIQIVTS